MKGKARKRSHSYSMLTRDWRGAHHRSLIDWICVVAPLYLWPKGSAMSSFVHFNRDWGKRIFFCQNFQTTNQELHGNQTASDRPPKVKPGKVWFKSPKSFKSVLLHDFLSLRENLFSWKVLKETWQLKVNCIWNLEKGTIEHARTNFPLIFSAQTPALHWQTEYSHDFRGARGRPTTTERYCQDVDYFVNYPYIFIVSSRSNNGSLVHFFLSPWDMSWSNLNMWHAQELLPDHLNMTSEPTNQSLESI